MSPSAKRSKPVSGKKPAPPPVARAGFPVWGTTLLLGLAMLLIYWPATRCGFVNFDDDLYVTANTQVQNGLTWDGLKWACFNQVASNWHPLTLLSHMLDCQLFGLNPWGHHLTNVLLHALNVALLFLLLQQLTAQTWRSVFVAALFAVLPQHVESVAWVSERKDMLSGCFGLLSLIFYARHTQKRAGSVNTLGPKNPGLDYGLALVCLALGLMSKAMLVTWPFVMFLLDYWPLQRFQPGRLGRLISEKIPFFALAVAGSLATMAVQRHAGAVATVEQLSLEARGANAVISFCRYLGMLFCPVNLAVFYPLPAHWPVVEVLGAGLLLATVSAFVWARRKSMPCLLMGWLWFLGTLMPVIGLVQVGDQSMADRYMYLPSVGMLILIVWGGCELGRRLRLDAVGPSLAGVAVTGLLSYQMERQLGYWHDSETLFRHALAVTEDNYVAHNNLGAVLQERGQLDDAIPHFQEAIRIQSYDASAIYNLANIYYAKGQFDAAITEYQQALRYEPDDPFVHNNLGNIFIGEGRYTEAAAEYSEVIHLKPDYAEAHNNLGFALQRTGGIDESIAQYQEAIRLKPDYTLAQNNLAAAQKLKDHPAAP